MPTIDELLRTRDEFVQTVQNQCNLLVLADQHLSTKQCPSRQELVPVLLSIQETLKSLADFLEILLSVLNDPEARAKLELLNFQEVMPNPELTQKLMNPKSVILRLANAFYENQTPTSLVWKQTFDLAFWYSYYRGAIANLGYIFENHIKGYLTNKEGFWDWIIDFYDQYTIIGLRSIVTRAKFLEISDDAEIQAGEAIWWCAQTDSFPKVSSYYCEFIDLLDHCPDAKNPLVIERLKEFAQFEPSDENESIKNQQEAIQSKAVSLLAHERA